MFVDARDPRDDYRLTYNCLAAPDNSKTFNDGYHVVHHANSRVHWADMPAKFLSSLARHAASDGVRLQCCLQITGYATNRAHEKSGAHRMWGAVPPRLSAALCSHMRSLLNCSPPKNKHTHGAALVFEGLHFFDVGVAVFSRQWGVLADALVPLSDRAAAMSREERIAMLKARCRPVIRDERLIS